MISASQIKDHMEVKSVDGKHIGTVDHMDGESRIKLTKQDSRDGKHHEIPLDWVDHVDAHVHLSKKAPTFRPPGPTSRTNVSCPCGRPPRPPAPMRGREWRHDHFPPHHAVSSAAPVPRQVPLSILFASQISDVGADSRRAAQDVQKLSHMRQVFCCIPILITI